MTALSANDDPPVMGLVTADTSPTVTNSSITANDDMVRISVSIPAPIAAGVELSFTLTPRRPGMAEVLDSPTGGHFKSQQGNKLTRPCPTSDDHFAVKPLNPVGSGKTAAKVIDIDLEDSPVPIWPVDGLDQLPSQPSLDRNRAHGYYVVLRGLKIGVFWDYWENVAPLCKGIRGADWKEKDTAAEAQFLWDNTRDKYKMVLD